jgi:signal transduction histidine kinase
MRTWPRLVAITAGCFALGAGVALLLFVTWMHAPASHTAAAVRYLLLSGAVSLAAGVAASLIVSRVVPNLGAKIALVCLLGSVVAIVNVVVTPLLMFSERSDFTILVITLLYFAVISLAFASIVGVLITRQIHSLHVAANRLAGGDLHTRVAVEGTDEVADLARTFNRMSGELNVSFEQQRDLERGRRDLIVAVSHDLRTPLASIRAMIEAINDGVITDTGSVQRYMTLIQHETEHLGQLIEDLFELARIEGGNLELRLSSVPLPELVTETVEGMRIQAREKGVELRASCAEDVPALALDGPRMQRVLVNLIQNAVRHTPVGGHVDVRVGRSNGHVELAVADTGEGIAPQDLDHVFEQFYRGEKSRNRGSGGAGLGLAIARGIVEAHRGTIRVESEPGRGSRFVVRL